jgi:phenylalanyl-tRNA synthetase beta chain
VKLVLSWMREFARVPEVDPHAVAARLAACGFEVAEVTTRPEPVVDFEITANRPDCLSVVGLAREAAVAFEVPLAPVSDRRSTTDQARPTTDGRRPALDVIVEAADLCPRYAAQVARVAVGPSPAWLAERLQAAGVRPINNVVDVTNYVMIERGHPMHAFDLDTLAGGRLVVRRAKPGERLQTLDGLDRSLTPEMLVIADAARPTAVAGVMGGGASEVHDRTTTIAIESAWFLPQAVRRTSRLLGLKTEASARFERGADIEAPVAALARAIELLEQIGAGEAVGPVIDRYAAGVGPRGVPLRAGRIAAVLGADVPHRDVERILAGLGFGLAPSGDAAWTVTPPTWRVDVTREADLIEEVGRHYGYDRLPTTFPALQHVAPAPDARIGRDHLARRVLMSAGFTEAVTFTFVERRAAEPFAVDGSAVAAIANPLSEKFSVLRPSLVPGLLDAVAHNRRRERPDVRLFETGACVDTAQGERRRVAFAWLGRAQAEHWDQPARGVDFFDARGAVEALCRAFGIQPRFTPALRPYLAPGRAAEVTAVTGAIGVVGQLHPALATARDVPGGEDIYVAELDLDALGTVADLDVRAAPLPRFPSIVRDLSILVPDGLPAADVRGTIRSAAPPTLIELHEFDRYQGKGIPEGRVSLSYHLTFRAPDRTLTDAEVDEAMNRIVASLEQERGATRR